MNKEVVYRHTGYILAGAMLVYRHIYISTNDLPGFPSASLVSLNDATASPRSAALQSENPFCVICLKVNVSVH